MPDKTPNNFQIPNPYGQPQNMQGQQYPTLPGAVPQYQANPETKLPYPSPTSNYPQQQPYPYQQPQTPYSSGQQYPPNIQYSSGQQYPPNIQYSSGQQYPVNQPYSTGQQYPPNQPYPIYQQNFPPQPRQGQQYPPLPYPGGPAQNLPYPPQPNQQYPAQINPQCFPPTGGYPGSSQIPPQVFGKKGKKQYVCVGPLTPSLRADLQASPSADAIIIHSAFRGLGCDQDMIIKTITQRTSSQLEKIQLEFDKAHKRSLIKRSKDELYWPLKYLVTLRLYTGYKCYAYAIFKSIKGMGTDDDTLIYIMCTLSSKDIEQVKAEYFSSNIIIKKVHGKTLEADIRSDTSGNYRELLLALIHTPRDQSTTVNDQLAQKLASELYTAVKKIIIFKHSVIKISAPASLIKPFTTLSIAQFRLVLQHFFKMSGKTLYCHLKSYICSNYEKSLMTICILNYLYQGSYITNPLHYHSKYLRNAIIKKNLNRVINIVVSRCEIDLATIQQDYLAMYNVTAEMELKNAFQIEHPNTVRALLNLMGCP